MHVDTDKEKGGSVGVHAPDKSAVVYVPADMGDGGKGCSDVRGVVHGQK